MKNIYNNSLTAVLINLYNLGIFLVAAQDIANSKLQAFLIIINILIYMFIYLIIFKNSLTQK